MRDDISNGRSITRRTRHRALAYRTSPRCRGTRVNKTPSVARTRYHALDAQATRHVIWGASRSPSCDAPCRTQQAQRHGLAGGGRHTGRRHTFQSRGPARGTGAAGIQRRDCCAGPRDRCRADAGDASSLPYGPGRRLLRRRRRGGMEQPANVGSRAARRAVGYRYKHVRGARSHLQVAGAVSKRCLLWVRCANLTPASRAHVHPTPTCSVSQKKKCLPAPRVERGISPCTGVHNTSGVR